MKIDIKHFKDKLEEEKKVLESELSGIGRINPTNSKDWEPIPADFNTGNSDKNEVADKVEEYESRTAITTELENRLNNIKSALERIESDKYGTCKVEGEQIEEDRLEANPAAETCKIHINE